MSVVKVEGSESSRCCVSSGMSQGSVLGPLLFLIYVNDLTDQFSSEHRIFADDALCITPETKRTSCRKILINLVTGSENGNCHSISIRIVY